MFERLKPGRLLIELGVVVLGVGIALAADTWREELELRDRELAYLRAIEADMEEAANVLESAFDEDSEYAEKTKASLALLLSNAPPTSEEGDWSARVTFSLAQFSVPTGTLHALIGSGDLTLVLSEELRATLIAEYAAIGTYQSWIDQAAVQAFPNMRDVSLELQVLRIRATGEPITFESFRQSPQIAAGFLTHLTILRNILNSIQSTKESVGNIHNAVKKELERRGG
jgi:hypothetical protein